MSAALKTLADASGDRIHLHVELCVWSPAPQSGVAHGLNLIPVSGVGEAVGDEKIGGNGVSRTFNKDMANDEITFLDTQRIVMPLSQMCNHIWRAQRERGRVCAYGEVLSVHPPSRSWQLPLSGRETARKKKSEKCLILRMESGFSSRSDVSVQVSLHWSVRDSGVVVVIADPIILCLATLESAILVIDGPKMKSSTTLGFLSMLMMKMTRNTSSS